MPLAHADPPETAYGAEYGFHSTPHNLGVLLESTMTVWSPVLILPGIHRWDRMIILGMRMPNGPRIRPRSFVTCSTRNSDYMRDEEVISLYCLSDCCILRISFVASGRPYAPSAYVQK